MLKNKKYQKVVAITGGIGTGKSLICKVFSVLGALVYSADDRAKYLVQNSVILKSQICNLLGDEAYDFNGNYDRKFVSQKVFEDDSLLKQLNDLVHPFVKEDFESFINSNSNVPLIIYEAALLINKDVVFDFLVWVDAPLELRISRVIQRDKRSRDQVLAIIAKQPTPSQFTEIADFVVVNDNTQSVLKQIMHIKNELDLTL
ncbi:MAG: dephospho-CoA kinase [Pseudarcicella sp.]|nr:dephospho-CoA kinase [Pseudarcicella sp.]